MYPSNKGFVRHFTALGLLLGSALVVTPSCGGTTKAGTDSNTHWLRSCANDDDCGSLECLCGVCTRGCNSASECIGLGAPAVCEPLSSCTGTGHTSSVCTAECSGKSDCAAIGAGLVCVDGRCEAASSGSLDPTGSAGLEAAAAAAGGRSSGGGSDRADTGGSSSTRAGSDSGGSTVTGGAAGDGGVSGRNGGPEATGGAIPGSTGGESSGGAAPVSGGVGGQANGGAESSGGNARAEGGAGGVAISGDRLVLDPSSLVFYYLPIGSLRGAVTGYDPKQRACATIVWEPPQATCNVFDVLGANLYNPYVVIKTDTAGPCTEQDWDYQGNVATTGSTGCVDFASLGGVATDMVDVEINVEGSAFTGTIVANNRPDGMVSIGLEYVTDVPENVYVQTGDDFGLPGWLRVTKDGQPVGLFDRCDVPNCETDDGVCGIAFSQAINITSGTESGSIYVTWDGRVWSVDEQEQCLKSAPAAAGTYQLEVCYGSSTEDSGAGPVVVDPVCTTQEFAYPTDLVVLSADNGG